MTRLVSTDQFAASAFLTENKVAILPPTVVLKMDVIMHAFTSLCIQHKVSTILIVAPLQMKTQLEEMYGAVYLHGHDKGSLLAERPRIAAINPEGLEWLTKFTTGMTLPFDIIAIPELAQFGNWRAKKYKLLFRLARKAEHVWGSISFVPDLLKLWSQVKLIDGGKALGVSVLHFQSKFLHPTKQFYIQGYRSVTTAWQPRKGAVADIRERTKDLIFSKEIS